MNPQEPDLVSAISTTQKRRPLFVTVLCVLLAGAAVVLLAGSVYLTIQSEAPPTRSLLILLAGVFSTGMTALVARGLWALKNWARTAVMALIGVGLIYFGVTIIFEVASIIFAGEHVVPIVQMFEAIFKGLIKFFAYGGIPCIIVFGLIKTEQFFVQEASARENVDQGVRYLLIVSALSAIFIVFLIILFTFQESTESITEVGLIPMLLGTVWRPGSIIGGEGAQYGMLPMIVGTILSTIGAALLGVPLSIGTAILLAEIAPAVVRETVRPAVELLAGIPSVVYGLFGMVVLAPFIRVFEIPYNTGFGLLNASIILAVMILPTVTNIAEDAIRAVPRSYKEGALALGATHWQTIWQVMLPAARSGLVAAVILGIGRALGETMAVIMVIGNAIAMPRALNENPLTILLSPARTLTGNIAVEINYAAGTHRSALFFTGVLLFLMILFVNRLARYLMRERLAS